MEFRQEVNDIASRDTTLGVLANQIVSSYDNGNYMTCFFGISVLGSTRLFLYSTLEFHTTKIKSVVKSNMEQ